MQNEIKKFAEQVYGREATEQDLAFAKLVYEAERLACANCCDYEVEHGYSNAEQIGAANCSLAIYGRGQE